jgi:hypothetical protein
MSSRTRRSLLQFSGTLCLTGLAGCATFGQQSQATLPRLGELKALNLDDQPRTVHVLIEKDRETVWQASKRMKAAPSNGATGIMFEGYPSKPAPYIVYAWKDNQSREDARSFDFSEQDAECVGLNFQIGDPGVDLENPHLAIFTTTNCPK